MFDLPKDKSKWEKDIDWKRKLERKKNPKIQRLNNHRINRLKSTRILLGHTQEQLVKRVGISLRAYQTYEQELSYPKISTALKIADFLGSSCEYLWGTPRSEGREKNSKHSKNKLERQELNVRQKALKEMDIALDKKSLKKYRTFLGYSQPEFANRVGVALSTYRSYEQELREPNVQVAINMAYYLDTNCYTLFATPKRYDYSYRWEDK